MKSKVCEAELAAEVFEATNIRKVLFTLVALDGDRSESHTALVTALARAIPARTSAVAFPATLESFPIAAVALESTADAPDVGAADAPDVGAADADDAFESFCAALRNSVATAAAAAA